MRIYPAVYHGWVAITSVIAIVATARYIAHWLSSCSAYDDALAAQQLLRVLNSVMVGCSTVWKQVIGSLGESGRWTTDQLSSTIGIWGVPILCSCIVLILALLPVLWAAPDEPLDVPLKRPFSDVSGDAQLQSAMNALAATKTRARKDNLATRYLFKWRLIVAKAKHLEDDRFNIEGAQDSEDAEHFEEAKKEPTSLQQSEGVSPGIINPQSPPVPASIEPTGPLTRPSTPAPESPSSTDALQYQPTAQPETSSESESPSFPTPGGAAPLPNTLDDAPKPAHAQSRSSEWRNKANKGLTKFQKAPQEKTAIPTWLANKLAQEVPTDQQSIPALTPPSPTPEKGLPKSPNVTKDNQFEVTETGTEQPLRLADMVFDVEGPVKPTKCAHDKDCAVRVCGKAHHGPYTDPTKPFKLDKWCWHDQNCTRQNCYRWHSSPASVDRPTRV